MSSNEEKSSLGPDSSLKDLFDDLRPPEGMRVVPISLARTDGTADLAIIITGKEEDANVLMANLMSYVNELFAVSEQIHADKIIGTDGKPVSDEPKIVVPN